jgi:MSHA biogenesis protein MshO
MMQRHPKFHCGFTLVEMIIVIVITGIIGGMVAMFIRAPVQGYVDSARRAEMSDIADGALRRIGRDVRTAVPNSVRLPVAADSSYFEFIPTKDGGRYRVSAVGGSNACGADGDNLDFTMADPCFEIVGERITFAAGDQIVIGSTQPDGNLPYMLVNAASGVRRAIAAPGGVGNNLNFVRITPTVKMPDSAEPEGQRFEVVPGDQQAVMYACTGTLRALDANGNGQGALTRFQHYNFNPVQVGPAALGVTGAMLANNVFDCHFAYTTDSGNNSLLFLRITITRGGESVNLYHEIHVNNIP